MFADNGIILCLMLRTQIDILNLSHFTDLCKFGLSLDHHCICVYSIVNNSYLTEI